MPFPHLILVAEPGHIEHQTLHFVRSFRANGGRLKDAAIWVYHDVRANQAPLDPKIVEELKSFDVVLQRPKVTNVRHAHYPYANKIYAMADAEERLSDVWLTWMDSDMLCLQEPTALLMPPNACAAAHPAHLRNIQNPHPGKLTWYWQEIFRLAEIEPHQYDWPVFTLPGDRIYPYFNGGVMQTRCGYETFTHTRKILNHLSPAFSLILPHPSMHHLLDQALCSACLLRAIEHPDQFHQLPLSCNMPLHALQQKVSNEPFHLLHY